MQLQAKSSGKIAKLVALYTICTIFKHISQHFYIPFTMFHSVIEIPFRFFLSLSLYLPLFLCKYLNKLLTFFSRTHVGEIFTFNDKSNEGQGRGARRGRLGSKLTAHVPSRVRPPCSSAAAQAAADQSWPKV